MQRTGEEGVTMNEPFSAASAWQAQTRWHPCRLLWPTFGHHVSTQQVRDQRAAHLRPSPPVVRC